MYNMPGRKIYEYNCWGGSTIFIKSGYASRDECAWHIYPLLNNILRLIRIYGITYIHVPFWYSKYISHPEVSKKNCARKFRCRWFRQSALYIASIIYVIYPVWMLWILQSFHEVYIGSMEHPWTFRSIQKTRVSKHSFNGFLLSLFLYLLNFLCASYTLLMHICTLTVRCKYMLHDDPSPSNCWQR